MKRIKNFKSFKSFKTNIFMSGLSWKERLIAWYFVFSLFGLCVGDDTPVWVIVVVVANFANAARLVRKIRSIRDIRGLSDLRN